MLSDYTSCQINQIKYLSFPPLIAGERAMASSSFDSAAKYLMLGVTLLPDDSWGGDYDLTIRLYDAGEDSSQFPSFLLLLQTSLLTWPVTFSIGSIVRDRRLRHIE